MKLRCFVDGKVVSTSNPGFKNLDELMEVLMEEGFPDTSFQYPDGRLMRYEGLAWPEFRRRYRHPRQRPLRMRNSNKGMIYILDLLKDTTQEGA